MSNTREHLPAGWEIPEYRIYELRPRTAKYCICIPVINEGKRLTQQLDRMAKLGLKADILIGDGGSRDGSGDPDEMRKYGVHSLLVKTGPGKLSAQLRMLFGYAIQQGYEGIVTIDGNGKDGVEAIPSFLEELDRGWDFIQGSRYVPGGHEENTPLDRKLGLRWLHAPLLSLAARFRYTDTTNGFRAFSIQFLTHPDVQPFRAVFDTYNLHYYLSIRAARLGFRVKELPVTRIYPASGPTPSKISGLGGKAHILKLLAWTILGRFNP